MGGLDRIRWTLRSGQWWNYKVLMAVASAYHMIRFFGLEAAHLMPALLLLLLGGFSAASFASLLNDYMDLDLDARAGKKTGLMTFSPGGRRLWLLVGSLGLLLELVLLRPYPRAWALFLAVALLHLAYTTPPLRLKERGFPGLLCVAGGEHVVACLFSVYLVADASGCQVRPAWCLWLLSWSLLFGLRSILWHQLVDYEEDRRSGAGTFGQLHGPALMRWLGGRVVFPLELACFFAPGFQGPGTGLLWLGLLYLLLEWPRCRLYGLNLVVVTPASPYRFAMLEFYQVVWPLFSLLWLVFLDFRALPLLLIHLCLFASPWLSALRELNGLFRHLTARLTP